MKLQKQVGYTCILYAAAMVLDVQAAQLLEEIGHNGLEIAWPKKQVPNCYRGIHIQEIQDCFWRRGLALAQMQLIPTSIPQDCQTQEEILRLWGDAECEVRFTSAIENRDAIIVGELAARPGVGHAVAWCGTEWMIYDPCGECYSLDSGRFCIREAWVKCRLI